MHKKNVSQREKDVFLIIFFTVSGHSILCKK